MKSKIIICGLIASLALGKNAVAQSSSAGTAADNRTIILEGKKFPMTASEYEAQKLATSAKQTQVTKTELPQPAVVIDKTSSLYQAPVKTTAPAQKADITGSVAPVTSVKAADKKPDSGGSIAPPVKKEEAKPVAAPIGAQSVNG